MEKDRRKRELLKFYGAIVGMLAAIWLLWGLSHLWFELHEEKEPTPLSLVEAAEEALSRGDAERARKGAKLAGLLIEARFEHAEGEERAGLLRLAERLSAVRSRLAAGAARSE